MNINRLVLSADLTELCAAAPRAAVAVQGVALGTASAVSTPLLQVLPSVCDDPLSALGLAGYGVDPGRVILVRTRSVVGGLQAALDAAREEGAGLGAILIDLPENARDYDLSASRRLRLAARESGVPVLVCRVGAEPGPSAARTRWLVRPAPSRPLGVREGSRQPGAPGAPRFDLTLLKSEDGRSGLSIRLEWIPNERRFLVTDPPAESGIPLPATPSVAPAGDRGWPAPLPGAVVPLPARRAEPPARPGPGWRRTG